MTDAGKSTVWDVLEEYADVHDELDDAIDMFSWVIEDMQTALSELEDQASEISTHLAQTEKLFRRFKARNPRYFKA